MNYVSSPNLVSSKTEIYFIASNFTVCYNTIIIYIFLYRPGSLMTSHLRVRILEWRGYLPVKDTGFNTRICLYCLHQTLIK